MNSGNQVLRCIFVAVASLALFAENRVEAGLEEAIKTNRYRLKVGENELSGPGAEFVVKQGGEAAFFLIGEVHGTRETAWLTNHLLERLRPAGYAAYALETGPITTSLLVQELRAKGQDAVAKLLTDYPMTSAFLNFREELEVVGNAVKQGYQVWGIDQEFMGSGRFLLAHLETLAPTSKARKLVGKWRDRANQGFKLMAESGDPSKIFMSLVTDADFDEFDGAFAVAQTEARRILKEMRATAAVYRHFFQGRYFENDTDRILLMKRYLLEGLDQIGPDDKVLIKLGGDHTARGYAVNHQLDVGNQANELGFARGGGSFHLFVCARELKGWPDHWADDTAHLAPLFKHARGDEPVVFDVRPLRPILAKQPKKYEKLFRDVLRYDAIMVFPTFRASTPVVPMPGR